MSNKNKTANLFDTNKTDCAIGNVALSPDFKLKIAKGSANVSKNADNAK
jgi:hypothetical protein